MTTPGYNINTFIKRYKINAKGEVPIYIKVLLNGQKIEQPTKLIIQPRLWDSKSGRLKSGEQEHH